MRHYAETKRHIFTKGTEHGWDIIKVRSESNPDRFYTVDVTHGRCSCPAWIHQSGGVRKPCKHLRKFGFREVVPFADFKEPVKQKGTTLKEVEK